MQKIGIYSGSFDPVHAGHIEFASEAAKVCGLETVVFLPERFPRNKPNVSPLSERVAELEIALAELPFRVIELPMDQFTVQDTLPELKLLYPNATFTFLVGSDVALRLSVWNTIDQLIRCSDFAVGLRAGDSPNSVREAMEGLGARYVLITTPHAALSSSALRTGAK